MRNIAECTKLGGYFIGTCYDGQLIFNLLKMKQMGESIELHEGSKKIWEITKEYDETTFDDDVTSLGYKIDVFQETINKTFSEYLVNFDYLERIMENYGFQLLTREDAKIIGLPEGSGLFSELFNVMQDEIKRNSFKKEDYGDAMSMTPNEKKISFLNRYFVFKKISHVNAEKVSMEMIDETLTEQRAQKKLNVPSGLKPVNKKLKTLGQDQDEEKEGQRKRAKRLNKKIVLLAATEAIDSTPDVIVEAKQEEKEKEKEEEKEKEKEKEEKKPQKVKKPRAKKLAGFVIEPDV
jgi:hypothetical protein